MSPVGVDAAPPPPAPGATTRSPEREPKGGAGEVDRRGLSAGAHLVLAGILSAVLGIAVFYYFVQVPTYVRTLAPAARVLAIVLSCMFLLFTLLTLVRYSIFLGLAYLASVRSPVSPGSTGSTGEAARLPTVSVLVPAWNEAPRIEKALDSLLAVDYPELEVIVVDDGSTDGTFEKARPFASSPREGRRVTVLRKENAGKFSALNHAFRHASGDLVLCVDADSHLDPSSVRRLVRRFDDPAVGGCAGQVRVRNRGTLTTLFQALEYVLLNGMPRQFQNFFGTVLIAPGPIAMFRRSLLEEVAARWPGSDGPWQNDTFAEDADLTMRVLLTGRKVVYEPRAIAFTAAPARTFALLNQRYRWVRGTIQSTSKAWRSWRETPGAPPSLPFWFGHQIFDALVWPAVNLIGLALLTALTLLSGPAASVLAWLLLITAIDLNAAAFCVKLERDSPRLLLLIPLFRFYFNVVLDVSKIFAVYDELRGRRMTWS